MQVSVETTNGLERKLKVAVEEERIAKAVDQRLNEMTRTVKVNGFRKGKVPLKVIKQQYGKQVRQDVINEVLQSTFYEALGQEKLRPAGTPNFDLGEVADSGIEYTATFEIYPEVQVADLSGEKIEKPVAEITDTDIDEMIENVRGQNKEWVEVSREAKEGDQVNIDFVGSIDGVAFPGGEAKGVALELGSGRMIKGFEEGLVGVKSGSDLTLEVTFPDDYHANDLAGKTAQFATHVNSVTEAKLPEINDDFAKKLGIKDPSVANLRQEIKESMQRELDGRLNNNLKTAVMDKLIEAHQFDIPAALIENESYALMQQMAQNLQQQGMSPQDLKMEPAMFHDQALRRVKLGLIMAEIVHKESIQADSDKVRAMVEKIAAPYEHPEQVVSWYYSDKKRLAEIESMVMEEQIVDWVMNQAQVVDKSMTFKELMNPKPAK